MSSQKSSQSSPDYAYPDNPHNRRLGRVGKSKLWWNTIGKKQHLAKQTKKAKTFNLNFKKTPPSSSGADASSSSGEDGNAAPPPQTTSDENAGNEQTSSGTASADGGADENVGNEQTISPPSHKIELPSAPSSQANQPIQNQADMNSNDNQSSQQPSDDAASSSQVAASPSHGIKGSAGTQTHPHHNKDNVTLKHDLKNAYTFQRAVVDKKGHSGTIPTHFHVKTCSSLVKAAAWTSSMGTKHPEQDNFELKHIIPERFGSHAKMGVLLGAFRGWIGGDMCDIPYEIATHTTIQQGRTKIYPAKLRKDGSVKKPARKVVDMKNRAYPTLASALEQIHNYADHNLARTNGGQQHPRDKTGCGVPVGVIFTVRGAVYRPKQGKNGGHYRIRWGYETLRDGYIQKKKCVYAYGEDDNAAEWVGRSPSMLYQPDHHDKSGAVAKSADDRKENQSSLVWIYSGALSSVQTYGHAHHAGCFHNKNKWDGFATDGGDGTTADAYQMCFVKHGGRRYYKKRVGGTDYTDKTSRLCPDLLEFNLPPAAKTKKATGKKKQTSSASATTSAADQKKIDQKKAMMDALAEDSDDELDFSPQQDADESDAQSDAQTDEGDAQSDAQTDQSDGDGDESDDESSCAL